MEKSNIDSQYQLDSLQSKVNVGSKVPQNKMFQRSHGIDSNVEAGTSQPRKTQNSRLDAMKRQFHKKASRPGMASALQKSIPNTSPRRANLYMQTSHDIDIKDSNSAVTKNTSHLPQALNASNFGVKGSLPTTNHTKSPISVTDKFTALQPENKSKLGTASRTSHATTSKTDGAKSLTSARQGRAKSRAMQMQKSASARQVLENVLLKEMKASSSSARNNRQENYGTDVKTSNASGSQVLDTTDIVAGSKPQTSASNFPTSNGLPTNLIANSSIREKLRQHQRQNGQVSTTKKEDHEQNPEIAPSGFEQPVKDLPQSSVQDSTNESILHHIRQKGPMIAKRAMHDGLDDSGGTSVSSKSIHIGTKLTNKISSRPGSPRTPRRKASPSASGRASPFSKRGQSPIHKSRGRNPSPNRRPPSPSTDGISPYSPEVTTKKVNRVLKARLYLLQQNGPNSFRIGGDSPEHKYLVIVGPQVETLFKAYQERCQSRIDPKKKSRVQRLVSHLASGSDKHVDGSSNSDDQSSSKGEEENCPICLLQMVDGESVTVCEVGCRNKLHTHCVNIWAEECKRNGGPLKCPLCRIVWKPASSNRGIGINTLMTEIPPEYRELASSWIQAFGLELVSFLFSPIANIRENALRRLSHDITGALLTNNQITANEERHSDDSDSSHEDIQASSGSGISSNLCLASCCAVLAMVCADPEYRVYITALRTLRGMMAYTQCRTDEDVQALQRLLVPVIETILLKCADSNRRTVQLSVSTVMELCRGQSGELAVGKEIAAGGGETCGVGDVKYLLSFLEFDRSADALSWQWMLGRLNALGELFREFRSELTLNIASGHKIEQSPAFQHLLATAKFATQCLQITAQPRVIKIARKVFLHAYTMATSSTELVSYIEDMIYDLPSDVKQKLTRKMTAIKSLTHNNPENSRKLIEERFRMIHSHSDDSFADGDVLDIHSPQAPPAAPYYHLAHPSSAVHMQPWYHQSGHSHSNFPHYDHEPMYPANSYRMPHAPFPNPTYAWTPNSHDKGVINEPTSHNHPPSPCTVTHPPTPPPSSVDTANLEAAIEVSLFRPIRSKSPGRDSSKPETQVPTSNPGDDDFTDEFDYEQELPASVDHDPPLRCFTVADAIAQGSLRPRPVAKLDPSSPQQQSDQHGSSHSSDRPARPSLLRLKSESSAFQDLISPRSTRPLTATEPRSSFASFASSVRDRSSSHDSTASSASHTDDYQQASERRRTVRELADSINRKHANKHTKKQGSCQANANVTRNSKSSLPSRQQQHTAEMEMVVERPEPAPNENRIDSSDCYADFNSDDVTASSKPIPLKGAIERRGTVERHREGLRYGANPVLRSRKLNVHKALAEESPLVTEKKSDPHISPFYGQHQNHSRTPAKSILKNSGIHGSPVRVLSSTVGTPDSVFGAVDSGIVGEFVQDGMSTSSGASRTSKSFSSNLLTSSESEMPPDDPRCYLDIRHEKPEKCANQKTRINAGNPESRHKILQKQLSKSNSLPKDVTPVDVPESPPPSSDEEDDQSTSSSNMYRCPSAPAGSLLSDNHTEAQSLFLIKDDSLVDESCNEHIIPQTSPIRRRTPVRKLPSRPKTLAQRKRNRNKQKRLSSHLNSSVEDLDESDHSAAEKTPVTFKSEIGVQTPGRFQEFDVTTPTSSNYNPVDGMSTYEDDLSFQCTCRMQIEEEEDKLFAHTLAVSYVQDGLPLVPHLSFTDEEHDIVRTQNEHDKLLSHVAAVLLTCIQLKQFRFQQKINHFFQQTSVQHEYQENKQWSKGAQIGLGAFSACYQARDIFTGTLMAVKQVNHVRCSPVEERQVLQVISEEISLMRRLSHPNIVRLHGVTKEGPLYNIFVEWCAGGSVSTLLSLYGSFNEKVIVNYTLQMLRGLAYLHEQQLIHRDIKGANLLVDSTGQRLRISDFGAAARLASKGTGAGEFQGQLMGTIAFMAPEVLRGEQYGRSCDIWSAGCVITEMTSGKPPWEADKHSNHLALIFKIASAPSVPPIPESLSPALKDLCRRCLQAEPRDRPLASELLRHPVFIKW